MSNKPKTFTIDVEPFWKVKFHTNLGDDFECEALDAWDYWSATSGDPIEVYVRDEKDMNTLVHEVYHSVQIILDSKNIKDKNHETWAYLIWHIVEKFIERVGLVLTKKQKGA